MRRGTLRSEVVRAVVIAAALGSAVAIAVGVLLPGNRLALGVVFVATILGAWLAAHAWSRADSPRRSSGSPQPPRRSRRATTRRGPPPPGPARCGSSPMRHNTHGRRGRRRGGAAAGRGAPEVAVRLGRQPRAPHAAHRHQRRCRDAARRRRRRRRQERFLARSSREAERLTRLANDLLTLQRIEGATGELPMRVVDLRVAADRAGHARAAHRGPRCRPSPSSARRPRCSATSTACSRSSRTSSTTRAARWPGRPRHASSSPRRGRHGRYRRLRRRPGHPRRGPRPPVRPVLRSRHEPRHEAVASGSASRSSRRSSACTAGRSTPRTCPGAAPASVVLPALRDGGRRTAYGQHDAGAAGATTPVRRSSVQRDRAAAALTTSAHDEREHAGDERRPSPIPVTSTSCSPADRVDPEDRQRSPPRCRRATGTLPPAIASERRSRRTRRRGSRGGSHPSGRAALRPPGPPENTGAPVAPSSRYTPSAIATWRAEAAARRDRPRTPAA